MDRNRICASLARWYKKHRRNLPWRVGSASHNGDIDPAYGVWVSELMLQQTRVETVGQYFGRFVSRFPDVRSLAAASIDEVLQIWQGLGYYARARHLHAAAKVIAERHGGRIPGDVAELQALPGVGRYTAGAIASIGLGRRAAVVDGNVARVLARLFCIRHAIRRPATQKRLWELAESLLPASGCGEHNQALMELGALVCRPTKADCQHCPLRTHCRAYEQGLVEKVPVRSRSAEPKEVSLAVGAVWHRGRLVVVQRPLKGIWGGLWELPSVPLSRGEDPENGLRQHLRRCLGIRVGKVGPLGALVHRLSHRRLVFEAFECSVTRRPGTRGAKNGAWVRPEDLVDYAFPRAHQKLLQRALDSRG